MKSVNLLNFYLKAIRDTGLTNMWDSNSVQYYAFHLGFYELVTYIEDKRNKYGVLLVNSDYDKIPSFEEIKYYKEQLEEGENIQEEVRELILEKFEYLFEEYKENNLFDFYSLDIELDEIKEAKYDINKLIEEKYDYHTINYQITLVNGYNHISGEFYLINGGIYSTKLKEILSLSEWIKIKEKISEEKKTNPIYEKQYKMINERYRVKELLQRK